MKKTQQHTLIPALCLVSWWDSFRIQVIPPTSFVSDFFPPQGPQCQTELHQGGRQGDVWMCFLSTLRISRDLQSLVGTGDPISETLPKRESNKTPSFLGRVQSLILRAWFFPSGFWLPKVEGVENDGIGGFGFGDFLWYLLMEEIRLTSYR